MVLFESNVGLPGETTRIRLQGMHEALNLSADLLVFGLPPISQSNLTRFRLHFQHTPPSESPPACPEPRHLVAGDNRGF